jgi:hypothetical protein
MPHALAYLGILPFPADLLAWAEAQPEGLHQLLLDLLRREQWFREEVGCGDPLWVCTLRAQIAEGLAAIPILAGEMPFPPVPGGLHAP